MSLIHPQSSESMNSQIDWFSIPPTNTAISDGFFEQYHPIATLTDTGPIEFAVNGSDYLDLAHTYINIKARIVKADGTAIAAAAKVTPVNNWLHSLISQVDISLNGKLITPSTNTYAYRSYLETLLNYGHDAKTGHLTNSLWFKDDASEFETVAATNIGVSNRLKATKESAVVDMIGRLHADIFFQERYLLSGVEVKIRLIRSKDTFSLMVDGTDQFRVNIKEASLYVRKVKLDPTVEISAMKALEKGTAKYPIKRIETKVFSIPRGSLISTQQNLVLGQLPTRVIIGFVDNAALNGDYTKNPFNFRHFKVNYLALRRNGTLLSSKAFTPDFTNKTYSSSYMSMFLGSSKAFQNWGNGVSYEDYRNGYTLWTIDLSPDLVEGDDFDLIQTGNLSLEVHFAEALTTTINVVCLLERPNMIEIDKARNVLTDFTA